MTELSLRETAAVRPLRDDAARPGRPLPPYARAILWGGAIAGVLDAADGVVAFGLVLGMNPLQVLQYIASGLLGTAAFAGGLAAAALGGLIHFVIAFVAAGVYVGASRRVSALAEHPLALGAAYGVAVYLFMNDFVLPLSAVPPAAFSAVLFLNGIVGHAIFVGIPIAWAARREREGARSPQLESR